MFSIIISLAKGSNLPNLLLPKFISSYGGITYCLYQLIFFSAEAWHKWSHIQSQLVDIHISYTRLCSVVPTRFWLFMLLFPLTKSWQNSCELLHQYHLWWTKIAAAVTLVSPVIEIWTPLHSVLVCSVWSSWHMHTPFCCINTQSLECPWLPFIVICQLFYGHFNVQIFSYALGSVMAIYLSTDGARK